MDDRFNMQGGRYLYLICTFTPRETEIQDPSTLSLPYHVVTSPKTILRSIPVSVYPDKLIRSGLC